MGSLLGQPAQNIELLGRLEAERYESTAIREFTPTTQIPSKNDPIQTTSTNPEPIRYREPEPTEPIQVPRETNPILIINDEPIPDVEPDRDPSDGARSGGSSTDNGFSNSSSGGQTNFKAIGQNVIDRVNNDLIPYLKSIPPTYYAVGGGVVLAVILLRR